MSTFLHNLDARPPWNALLLVSGERGDASDRSYGNRTPTVGSGATFTTRCIDFDGTANAVVSYPDDNAFDAFPLTVMCWARIDSYTGFRNLICKNTQTGTYTGWHFYYGPGVSRGLAFGHQTAVGTQWRQAWSGSGTLSAGTWYHLAATISALNATPAIYINGVAQSVSTAAGAGTVTSVATAEPVRLGGKGGPDFTQYHDGGMDDARVFSTVLTAVEVYASFIEGLGITRP